MMNIEYIINKCYEGYNVKQPKGLHYILMYHKLIKYARYENTFDVDEFGEFIKTLIPVVHVNSTSFKILKKIQQYIDFYKSGKN